MASKKKNLSFVSMRGVEGLMLARKDNAWMAAFGLSDGAVCLFSPLKGLELTDCPLGSVSHLLAPNHYHNKGLASFSKQYSRATVCAPAKAATRLKKLTGLSIKPLTSLVRRLPDGFELLEPPGLKTGEVWLRFPVGKATGWLVVDSFCGKKMSSTSTSASVPELLRTFPSFAVDDNAIYVEWVLEQIRSDKPRLVIPCHGSVIRDTGLPAKLTRLIKTLL